MATAGATLADRIDAFLRARGSPLAGHGTTIVAASRRYRFDPRLLVGIAGAETSFATDPNAGADISARHNAWGWGPHLSFPDWDSAIVRIASAIGSRPHATVAQVQQASGFATSPGDDPHGWIERVSAFMHSIDNAPVARTDTQPLPSIVQVLKPEPNVDLSHVDEGLLGRLYALAVSLGKSIDIFSGYRNDPHGQVSGIANDPHNRGLAVDARIDGHPIGDVVPLDTLAKYGLEGGNQPGFDPLIPGGRDPEHVQLPGAGVNKSEISPAVASPHKSWTSSVSGWISKHWAGVIAAGIPGVGPAGVITGVIDAGTGAVSGAAKDAINWLNPTSWVVDAAHWLEHKLGYAITYAALVFFAVALAIIGVLRLLGIRFGTVVEAAGPGRAFRAEAEAAA